jgi:hypothetical protein
MQKAKTGKSFRFEATRAFGLNFWPFYVLLECGFGLEAVFMIVG